MIKIRLALAIAATFATTAALAAPASAAPVTLGSPLTAPFSPSSCDGACTVIPLSFNEQGAAVRSPVDGVVVRWNMLMGTPGLQYRLRVLSEATGLSFTATASSAPVGVSGPGLHTFPTNLPIKAGQLIGIDLPAGGTVGYFGEEIASDTYALFAPPLPDGQTGTPEQFQGEAAFNAVVQTRPTVAGISPSSGSFKGGTSVTITGSDFSGATAVSFGGLPAQSFAVVSDTQINAVAPASPKPGTLPVAVTTVAGTATAPVGFQSQACAVPKLKGKKLKGAKKRSRRSLCKVGKVKKIRDATAKTGEVVKQRPKPGALLPPGAKIKITLAP